MLWATAALCCIALANGSGDGDHVTDNTFELFTGWEGHARRRDAWAASERGWARSGAHHMCGEEARAALLHVTTAAARRDEVERHDDDRQSAKPLVPTSGFAA